MKLLTKVRSVSALVCVLGVFLGFLAGNPQPLAASVCVEALEACAFDALVAAFTAGPMAGAGYGVSCLLGYEFCRRYVFF